VQVARCEKLVYFVLSKNYRKNPLPFSTDRMGFHKPERLLMNIACVTSRSDLANQMHEVLFGRNPDMHVKVFEGIGPLVRALGRGEFDVLVLENLGEATFEFLRQAIVHPGSQTPAVLVGDAGVDIGLEEALSAGAEDYVNVSVIPYELAARVRACQQRLQRREINPINAGQVEYEGYSFNKRQQAASFLGKPIELTTKEFELAWMLFSNIGRCLSYDLISEVIWGTTGEVAKRTIEQHIYRTRRKLSLQFPGPLQLRTVYGKGYRLDAAAAIAESERTVLTA
jgi:DNA-binding response OmpR family regulator